MKKNSFFILIFILILSISNCFSYPPTTIHASQALSFVVLSDYTKNLAIADEFYLLAFTSNGKRPSFKSSNSRIASVDTYGKITAKKAGTATITVKIKHAQASCKVRVKKTIITLNASSARIERNERYQLYARTSNNSMVTYKSNRKSIALVDENGCILGIKPGEAIITVKADGSTKTFRIIVKEPTIQLNATSLTLYRGETYSLSAIVSSQVLPTWKTNRSRTVLVDNSGTVTAIKHGTAIITAKVDGTIKTCKITVKSPKITLSDSHLSLKENETYHLKAIVSSGNIPTFQSSNSRVACVDELGVITAQKKGSAYITVTEDGTKVKCKITVTP